MQYDLLVLGAGIVGTSVALHAAKRGMCVVLIDSKGVGNETSYGNAGVIEGSTVFPPTFPSDIGTLMRVALKRTPEANYHLTHLPRILPWLLSYRAATRPARLIQYAHAMRPLFSRAIIEHQKLLAESGGEQYLRKNGWLKLYRSDKTFFKTACERNLAEELGINYRTLTVDDALALEPHISPLFRHAIYCAESAHLSNPREVTRSYAKRFLALGGHILMADARSLCRLNTKWSVRATGDNLCASDIVLALGPWTPDILKLLKVRLPLRVKRGYHLHFKPRENTMLNRPTLDADIGYYVAPMEQGLRVTTGVEFATRDAPKTPVQFNRLMPYAENLFPLGEQVEPEPWMGCRPCFPDSMPIIGRAHRRCGVWLAFGHAHWGMTLGPVTGRLLAEMITGETPFCDPAPYSAERFL